MQLIKNPRGFDVVLAENLFGDILSDEMAMIAGSLACSPAPAWASARPRSGASAMYEPSAHRAGMPARASPIPFAQILSAAMMLRYPSASRSPLIDRGRRPRRHRPGPSHGRYLREGTPG